MIYSDNMITWKRTSNVCSNPKERSHSSMVRNYRFVSKFNNQQWWQPGLIIRRRRTDSVKSLKLLWYLVVLVSIITLEVHFHDRMDTYSLCKQWYQQHNILQEFQHSGAISAEPPYYCSWPIFDGWAVSVKKRGYICGSTRVKKRGKRCGADEISIAIDGIVATAEYKSRSRIPSGSMRIIWSLRKVI